MNPSEALALLEQAASMARLTRDEHVRIMQAVAALRPIIEAAAQPDPVVPRETSVK